MTDRIISYGHAADYYSKKFNVKREKVTEIMDIFLNKYGWDKTFDHDFTENFIKSYIRRTT